MSTDFDPAEMALVRQSFQEESGEILNQMQAALLLLEQRPADAQLVAELFRGAHTIKGNARVVGVDSVAEVTHACEDLLDGLRSRRVSASPETVTLLLRALDHVRGMIGEGDPGELRPEHRLLIEELRRTGGRKDAPAPAPENAPAAEVAAEPAGVAVAGPARTLRVPVARLDRLMDLAGEISIQRGRVAEILGEGREDGNREALEVHHEADRLYMDLQELIMQMRMVPVGPLFREYARVVRDYSLSTGKGVRLAVSGEEVEVDTSVVEHLRDPLTHLVRNCLTHGIEMPEERLRAGKPPVGTVTLGAWHDAGSIIISVRDDGAGINRDRVRRRALESGLLLENDAPADQRLLSFIFEPGFSTAETVSEISGRGVGMDVVRRNVELLRGSVSIDSLAGLGTAVTIRLPLTLAIIDGFKVRVADEVYVVPLDTVVECVERPPECDANVSGNGVLCLRGKVVPFVRLRSLLALEGEPPPRESVLIVHHEGREMGFAVDFLLGEGQTVIKPLHKLFKRTRGLAGSSILGNGKVAFILDVPGLLEEAHQRHELMTH